MVDESPAGRIPWRPGMPVTTEPDHADWQVWRRERILEQQRKRRRTIRRIDYYPSKAAGEVIDRTRTHGGGDASSILNRIVIEWAAASGIK